MISYSYPSFLHNKFPPVNIFCCTVSRSALFVAWYTGESSIATVIMSSRNFLLNRRKMPFFFYLAYFFLRCVGNCRAVILLNYASLNAAAWCPLFFLPRSMFMVVPAKDLSESSFTHFIPSKSFFQLCNYWNVLVSQRLTGSISCHSSYCWTWSV